MVSVQMGTPAEYIPKEYNNKTTLSLEENKAYYGYVKNSSGVEGYCGVNVERASGASCTHSTGGSSNTCTLTYRLCECWDGQEKWMTHKDIINTCDNRTTTPEEATCSGYCSQSNGTVTNGGNDISCTCGGTGAPTGYICASEGVIKDVYDTETECKSSCKYGLSCGSGTTLVTTTNGNVCWSKIS